MAKRAAQRKAPAKRKTAKRPTRSPARGGLFRTLWWWGSRAALALGVLFAALVLILAVLRPPTTPYILAEGLRLGGVERRWIPLDDIAPALVRSVIAAEDANFCLHWGFDMAAIRDALEDGAGRGASTLSQQTVKNVFLWQGRSWPRKALESLMTPVVELVWSKRRIVEVYLNVAEFDRGVFGAEAAARHYFGKGAGDLSAREAALLAAILPDPKGRSAAAPSDFVTRRARAIRDGAATIAADGRDDCVLG